MNDDLVVGMEIGNRWFQRTIRVKLVERLTKFGLSDIGKDQTPISLDKARELESKIEDSDIMLATNQIVGGELFDKIKQRLRDLMNWVIEHQDQIMVIVKILMALILMFL